MNQLNNLVNNSSTYANPISALREFLDKEDKLESARNVEKMRFVGYVLELGYDTAKLITSDIYKKHVGGIPRGSFLIMAPINFGELPPHFTLLRVTGVSPTPLSSHVQQTYFEMHKKAMPELDVWTQAELQWGALDCDVLGMFYAHPESMAKLAFSGDVNNVVSAHRYKVFAPDEKLLNLIINGLVKDESRFELGQLRTMECALRSGNDNNFKTPAFISLEDFKGCRTAMFGKTRLGKSNVVKLIAQGMIEATRSNNSVGQLIFDINGEYANDNPQDGNASLRSAYANECEVYALTKRDETPSKPLKINFYETPDESLPILGAFLEGDNQTSIYIRSFTSVVLPSIEEIKNIDQNDRDRKIRKIQIFWAILHRAGFAINEANLSKLGLKGRNATGFNPHFSKTARQNALGENYSEYHPQNIEELTNELISFAKYINENGPESLKSSDNKKNLFDSDDLSLLSFLEPKSGAGPKILQSYRIYHDPNASNFVSEILELLNQGKTVILDLGNASDKIRRYFADMLSKAVFAAQEKKFVSNRLNKTYVQLYFEEAHNLFPPESKDLTGVYARFAKEGAKFHIGMVYSTQSPSTINKDLLAQTENFFIGHLSSQDEAKSLSRVQVAFSGLEQDILRAKTPGYMRMLTLSHRFVIPVQAKKFDLNK